MRLRSALVLGFLLLVTACESSKGVAGVTPSRASADATQPGIISPPSLSFATSVAVDTYDDPFAYCQAVGTIDAPDARYTGPWQTPAMVLGFARATDAPPASEIWSNTNMAPTLTWRCARGSVLVCYGSPCSSKASTDPQPPQALIDWCDNPPQTATLNGRIMIPASVTGHNNVYWLAWSCVDGKPLITGTPLQVDDEGYLPDYWYRVEPEDSAR